MTARLVLLRPQPGWDETAAAARALGLDVVGEPLFAVHPVSWPVPDAAEYDALLIASANALRHGGDGLKALAGLPVQAVGPATAAAARAAGFHVVAQGRGGAQALVDRIAAPARLLRLAGAAHVPLVLPPGVTCDTRIVYAASENALSAATLAAAAAGAPVLLHSGEAAAAFARQADAAGLLRAAVTLCALGPRIAALAGEGWGRVAVAREPHDTALLAIAQQVCQTGRGLE